jgi:asparagine synthase (glutamine-hydrolysing)
MCGILGYYQHGGLCTAQLRKGLQALDSLAHRGPDGAGVRLIDSRSGTTWSLWVPGTPADIKTDLTLDDYVDGQADLLLGHRRLSIFDLSSRGHQPMCDGQGNALIFNGEVYNFMELRAELEKFGHRFQSASDTEVILAAYRQWGPDCFARFNGMWSMLLFDPKAGKLLVTVDRIGVKQLYTYQDDGCQLWASEVKAIRKVVGERLTLSHLHLDFFLAHGSQEMGEETLFKEIRRFPPSHFRYAAPADHAVAPAVSYWDFPTDKRSFDSVERAAESLRSLLDDSIQLRMRSDVPWGTTLSGGLDSSSIVFAAQRLRKRAGQDGPIHSFTAIFPGEEGDESAFAKRVAAELELEAHYNNPLTAFDLDAFERFSYHQDFPVPNTSMYAQWSVMEAVGASPVKVLLDGQGGDELFAGYHHHVYKYGRDLLLHGRVGAYRQLVEEFCAIRGLSPAKVKGYITDDLKLYLRLRLGKRLPGPPEVTAWNKALTLREVLQLDIRSWVMPSLLRYEDRNSMAFGIEARLPFLDYRVVEFAMQIPDEYKIHAGWQKYILRMAMPELPDVIRWRKDKKGFTTPHNEWMRRHRDAFLGYAGLALSKGIALPPGVASATDLDEIQLFRYASLGLWLRD